MIFNSITPQARTCLKVLTLTLIFLRPARINRTVLWIHSWTDAMQIPIEKITIGKRIRIDDGELGELADSLKEFGQLHPVILNRDFILITGFRRLQAAKLLGWASIDARVITAESEITCMELEIEENIQRKNFTIQELEEAFYQLDRMRHPGFFKRIWTIILNFLKKIFPGKKR